MDFESYADSMKKQGYDQVVERVWKPLSMVAEHTNLFRCQGDRRPGRGCDERMTRARALTPPPVS